MIDLSHSDQHVRCVNSIQELVCTEFSGQVNAMCWERKLLGDFAEIVAKLEVNANIEDISMNRLLELSLTENGRKARSHIVNDFEMLQASGSAPVLNVITCYERDELFPLLPTDVYSFHVDRSPVPTDTFLCTYFGESSEIIPNAKATQKVLIPEIRLKLKNLYAGPEDGFEDFLSEYFFDLHYQVEATAVSTKLGIGNLWKLATDHPKSKVLPCIHRAPQEKIGEQRLLLIC